MAKIENIFKNPHLQDAVEYLQLNGFTLHNKKLGTFLTKDDKAVLIYADKVSFRELMLDTEEPEYAEYMSLDGINMLKSSDWMYMFHIADILKIALFKKNVVEANYEHAKQSEPFNMVQFAESIFKHAGALLVLCMFLFTSCKPQQKLYQQTGFFVKTADGYRFEPVTDWQEFTPANNPCDTVRQWALSPKKPKQ